MRDPCVCVNMSGLGWCKPVGVPRGHCGRLCSASTLFLPLSSDSCCSHVPVWRPWKAVCPCLMAQWQPTQARVMASAEVPQSEDLGQRSCSAAQGGGVNILG